ncbi:MAG: DDE-type integrase/transposase/recombinase [Planctomycetes bacterium]|nr:DDE-type integrase/transposase/recombinase [Planctomycetota bacterium]
MTQLEVYLRIEFADYSSARPRCAAVCASTRHAGIARLKSGKKSKLRDLYEATHPHEGWQLDGKGAFVVRFVDGTRIEVTVLSVLDDHSRAVLAAVVAVAEDTEAAVTVTSKAIAKWGLAERFQFDRGSAFDSHAFRNGLAALGVHRNYIKPRSPEWDGKIEAYHRCLDRWFVRELASQQVVDLEHLQQARGDAGTGLQPPPSPRDRHHARTAARRPDLGPAHQPERSRARVLRRHDRQERQEDRRGPLADRQLPRAKRGVRRTTQPVPLPPNARRPGGPRDDGRARDRAATIHEEAAVRSQDARRQAGHRPAAEARRHLAGQGAAECAAGLWRAGGLRGAR